MTIEQVIDQINFVWQDVQDNGRTFERIDELQELAWQLVNETRGEN